MTQLPGRREQKKALNRRRLAECAFRLFVERGFGEVTVADIAAEAGVSVTTLFSYFPTKESLVFDVDEVQEEALERAVRERPPGTSVLDAVEAYASATVAASGYDSEARLAWVRLVAESPTVTQYIQQTMMLRWRPRLVTALLETVDGMDEMEAEVCARHLLCGLTAVTTYLDAEVVGQAFGPLRTGMGEVGA